MTISEGVSKVSDGAKAALSDDVAVVFGLTKGEILFGGLMLGALATGCAGLDHLEDLLHFKIIVAIVLQVSGAAVAFATGRMSK